MQILYHAIALYLTLNLIVYLFREKKFLSQLSTAFVLVLFVLRLLLIK